MRKPTELTNYRDYIKSGYWTERKRIYFSTHPHVCEVCGHPDVELHHIKYGDYGHEQDKNLAALCRVHHQELHNAVALRKSMFYQTRQVVEDMRSKWQEMRNTPFQTNAQYKAPAGNSFSDFI